MKKINHSLRRSVTPVKIYFYDVTNIIDLLNEVEPRTLEISTKDHILSLEELKKLEKDEINYLQITCHDPHICLEFNSSSIINDVNIFVGEESTLVIGLANRIIDILKKRRKFITRFQNQTYAWGLMALYIFVMIVSGVVLEKNNFLNVLFGAYAFVLFVLIQILYALPSIQKNIIVLDVKNNRPSFYKRKKDEILLVIISAAIGAMMYAAVDILILK